MATYGIQNLPSPPTPTPSPVAQPQVQGGDMSSLLGPQLQQAQQAQQAHDMQEALRALMAEFRDMAMTIDALASQHPEAATEFRSAQASLRDAAMKVTSKLTRGQDAGSQPPILS